MGEGIGKVTPSWEPQVARWHREPRVALGARLRARSERRVGVGAGTRLRDRSGLISEAEAWRTGPYARWLGEGRVNGCLIRKALS